MSRTLPTADGGWILVSSSENPPPVDAPDVTGTGITGLGGAQAIVFAPERDHRGAYAILTGSRSNCAGAATPWGTWLSCEEVDDPLDPASSGTVFECQPTVQRPAVAGVRGRVTDEIQGPWLEALQRRTGGRPRSLPVAPRGSHRGQPSGRPPR